MGKMGKFRIDGMKELQKELSRMQNPEVFLDICARKLAARLLALVVKRTQVGQYPKGSGKIGGTLRRGWTGGRTEARAQDYVASLPVVHSGDSYKIKITNPVEYTPYVEYGHRTANHKKWVNGYFMLTLSEKELKETAPAALEKMLRRYLEGGIR